MLVRVVRAIKPLAAILLIASYAPWHSSTMACLEAMSHPMHMSTHEGGMPHHGVPFDCCCVGACACSTTVGCASGASTTAWRQAPESRDAGASYVSFVVVVAPSHRLPFAIGPPASLL